MRDWTSLRPGPGIGCRSTHGGSRPGPLLHWFRAHLRPIAAVALVALTGLVTLSSAVHDAAECHDECAAGVVRHDPWSHAIGGATADAEHTLHCILCHWTRISRPSTDAVREIVRPVAQTVRSVSDFAGAPLQILEAQPPLRSPPAASAHA